MKKTNRPVFSKKVTLADMYTHVQTKEYILCTLLVATVMRGRKGLKNDEQFFSAILPSRETIVPPQSLSDPARGNKL